MFFRRPFDYLQQSVYTNTPTLLFLYKTYAVKMGIEDGGPQGSQCFGADEVPTVCQNDAAVRYGA